MSNYHLPTIATLAGIALASGYIATNSLDGRKKRKKRVKQKIQKERDGKYIVGLENKGNACFLNSVLQAMATLTCLRSYLAERVDEQGEESTPFVPQNEFILQSVACALYATLEILNRPFPRQKSISPDDLLIALERKFDGTINRDQQDAHELFQVISSILTSEEEIQYRENVASLLDATTIKTLTDSNNGNDVGDDFEVSSVSSFGTTASMWSSFSVCTVGGQLRRRRRSPRNPFTGLAATKISCMQCHYTAPIRHHTFDNISLTVPQGSSFCTLEECLAEYTKVDTLMDYQCRKCTLLATLDTMTKEYDATVEKDEKHAALLQADITRLKDALQYNIEESLYGIPLVAPEVTRTTKQTMFANPPKALCLHLSRSIYHNNYTMKNIGRVDFTEYIDLSPYSTNGYLNVTEPSVSLNSPSYTRKSKTSLVYLRNMAAGHKFNHGENNAGLAIALNNNKPDGDSLLHNVLPSMSTSTIQYKLSAVIVHLGGDHDSGHFVTYRRKKLPTGNQVRSPFQQQQHQIPSRFWRCDDESVEEVDIDTVLEQEAYMLFYERD